MHINKQYLNLFNLLHIPKDIPIETVTTTTNTQILSLCFDLPNSLYIPANRLLKEPIERRCSVLAMAAIAILGKHAQEMCVISGFCLATIPSLYATYNMKTHPNKEALMTQVRTCFFYGNFLIMISFLVHSCNKQP